MSDVPLTTTPTGVAIAVWVVPGASRSVIQGVHGDRIKVSVAAPAEGGRANRAVAGLLAAAIGSEVRLKTGIRGRSKVFEVSGVDVETVRRKLGM